jgi:hypothetical protein
MGLLLACSLGNALVAVADPGISSIGGIYFFLMNTRNKVE